LFLGHVALAISLVQSPADSLTPGVYAAILDSFFVKPGIELLVIYPRTAPGHGHSDDFDYQNGLRGLGALPAGLQANYESRRSLLLVIPVASLPTRVPAVPLTDADAAALPPRNPGTYWQAFYQRFPGSPGVVSFSPVGFSADYRSALVMVDTGCGGRCGHTYYYLLEHLNGRWTIIRRAGVRAS
jgi:hypothetical protein